MKVLETHDSNEIKQKIKDKSDEKSIVFIDNSTSYVDIDNYVKAHLTV